MSYKSGRHFLQIPGPSNIPDRVLRALNRPTIDHRGPEFAKFTCGVIEDLKKIFQTEGEVVIYPSSGTGALEAALVNTLSPGDKILMFETGYFATIWKETACHLGFEVDFVPGDWRHGVRPDVVEKKLSEDREHRIKLVALVHNETSTGITNRIPEVRKSIDSVGHPALLMVDTISSLGSIDYRQDEWGVDITICNSQKGLMLPPGLGFNAISKKALKLSKSAKFPKRYWDWEAMIKNNILGFFPYTPSTNLLFGLRESLSMLSDEGLENVFARHIRLAEATRRAVRAWGLEICCLEPKEYSHSVTTVCMPQGYDGDTLRKVILERYNMSLGNGLGKFKGKVFRIGHLGDFNDLMLAGTLSGIEMGLITANIPFSKGGIQAALDYLAHT